MIRSYYSLRTVSRITIRIVDFLLAAPACASSGVLVRKQPVRIRIWQSAYTAAKKSRLLSFFRSSSLSGRRLLGYSFAILTPKLIAGFRLSVPLGGASHPQVSRLPFCLSSAPKLRGFGVCIGGIELMAIHKFSSIHCLRSNLPAWGFTNLSIRDLDSFAYSLLKEQRVMSNSYGGSICDPQNNASPKIDFSKDFLFTGSSEMNTLRNVRIHRRLRHL